jgi:hypothetical protein
MTLILPHENQHVNSTCHLQFHHVRQASALGGHQCEHGIVPSAHLHDEAQDSIKCEQQTLAAPDPVFPSYTQPQSCSSDTS